MKISYRQYPMLKGLETSSFNLSERDGMELKSSDIFPKLVNLWRKYLPNFSKNIQIVSNTFLTSVIENSDKLEPVLGDSLNITQSGTFMYKTKDGGSLTRCYYINSNDNDDYFVLLFDFVGDYLFRFLFINKNESIRFLSYHLDEAFGEEIGVIDRDWFHKKSNTEIFNLLSFIQHCETEEKLVQGGRKQVINNTKHVNDTLTDIKILDATWFTTIVKNDGFGVKGHFRFQPFGEGRSNRKLIWISDFEKKGYTRLARKITNSERCA